MEALWSLEEKWKLSTRKATALFACTCFLVIGVCVAAVGLRRRRSGSIHQEPCEGVAEAAPQCSVVKALMESVWWSKREASLRASQREAPLPLLAMRDVGWQSHNSASAVWQRPILMGEKCELPRFSGLILYDHKGMPLHHQFQDGVIHTQEIPVTPVVRTTLKDLL